MEVLPIQIPATIGKVYLIGAGPGDSDLLTVKALKLLKKADVVLYDALVSDDIMSLISPSAECIAVGKRAGSHSALQSQINQLMITKAYTAKTVIRLKGGDPFMFGRGGEELESLVDANIPFEVVPGITAAMGAAAYSGIPLTHRDYAQSVSFITGHCKLKTNPIDWQAYINPSQTLVIYMGILNVELISQGLIYAGRNASTPVAIVSKASTKNQQIIIGELENLALLAKDARAQMPALIIVGEVVNLSEQLNWFTKEQNKAFETQSTQDNSLKFGELI